MGCRRVLGTLLLVLIAIPFMSAVLIAAGVTTEVLNRDFLVELPRKFAERLPKFLDKVYEIAKQEKEELDPDDARWVEAMEKAGVKPSEFLQASGIRDWLEEDLSEALGEVQKLLEQGETDEKIPVLSLKNLKERLTSKGAINWLEKVVAQFPPCSEKEKQEWLSSFEKEDSKKIRVEGLPDCNPGSDAMEYLTGAVSAVVAEIPDEVPLFEKDEELHEIVGVLQAVYGSLWLLIGLAFLVLIVCVLIRDSRLDGIFGGMGYGFFWTGVSVLLFGYIIKYAITGWSYAAKLAQVAHVQREIGILGRHPEVVDMVDDLIGTVTEALSRNVIYYGWIALGAGVGFFILAFILRPRKP